MLTPDQCETALLFNAVSHWPDVSLESALKHIPQLGYSQLGFADRFQVLLLVVLVVFGTVDEPLASCMSFQFFKYFYDVWICRCDSV